MYRQLEINQKKTNTQQELKTDVCVGGRWPHIFVTVQGLKSRIHGSPRRQTSPSPGRNLSVPLTWNVCVFILKTVTDSIRFVFNEVSVANDEFEEKSSGCDGNNKVANVLLHFNRFHLSAQSEHLLHISLLAGTRREIKKEQDRDNLLPFSLSGTT